ncbi:MAG: hypothetical protein AABX03_04070 [Nanoarchaeota archaeon]
MKQTLLNLKKIHGEETELIHLYEKAFEVAKSESKNEVSEFLRGKIKEAKARASEIEKMIHNLN